MARLKSRKRCVFKSNTKPRSVEATPWTFKCPPALTRRGLVGGRGEGVEKDRGSSRLVAITRRARLPTRARRTIVGRGAAGIGRLIGRPWARPAHTRFRWARGSWQWCTGRRIGRCTLRFWASPCERHCRFTRCVYAGSLWFSILRNIVCMCIYAQHARHTHTHTHADPSMDPKQNTF